MLPFGHHETRAAQAVAAIKTAAIDRQAIVRLGCGPQPRPARRIEPLDDRLNVSRGLGRRYIAAHGGYGDDLQLRVRQCQTQGHGIIDARVDVEDYLSGHCICSYLEMARDVTAVSDQQIECATPASGMQDPENASV